MSSIWSAMWPNIFAPSAWTLIGITVSHVFMRAHHNRKFEELKAHLAPQPIITYHGTLTKDEGERIRAHWQDWLKKNPPKGRA